MSDEFPVIGWYTPPEGGVDNEPEALAFPETNWCKPITVEFTMTEVDPEVLALLTGGAVGETPEFGMDVVSYVPVRRRAWRVVWEWLRRTPREHTEMRYHIPHATAVWIGEEKTDG